MLHWHSICIFLILSWVYSQLFNVPDNNVHGANTGPTWILLAPDGPHVGPINLAIGGHFHLCYIVCCIWQLNRLTRDVPSTPWNSYEICTRLTHWPLGYFNKILKIICELILVIDGCDISSEIALRWMSLDLSDDKTIEGIKTTSMETLVRVIAWSRQKTSHYLNQCWPRSLPPYGVNRPLWVQSLWLTMICVNVMPLLCGPRYTNT